MQRKISYVIPPEAAGFTVRRFLREKGYSSQSLIQIKKSPDGTLINGIPGFQNHRLCPGDSLLVQIREERSSVKILPVELSLSVVYEDEDLIVLNKPAGMPTHPSMKNYENTLANALAWYFARQDQSFVFRVIGRLDRDTSGLVLVAKHFLSAGILSGKPVEKEYLAIVRGELTPPEGTVDVPLTRKPGSIIERTWADVGDPASNHPSGAQSDIPAKDVTRAEPAVTHYRLLHKKDGHSLVSLTLETGRTHQIRVHMKYLGFPLIGDYLYNPDYERMTRQALHVSRLRFRQPVTGALLEFTAPLPEDMAWMEEP